MQLIFDQREAQAEALAYVRKESLDIYNRLHSIAEDVHFVQRVHESYPDLPVLPNLRCGAWYVDPEIATDEPVYFKSTDGHFGNWNFNLRRPNLHLLPLIIAHNGIILVDSTRAGKRIPDALSKTVPIWCAVLNRAMAKTYPDKKDWNVKLYCPPGAVSEQERAQIEVNLDKWADALLNSAYTLPEIPCPLRPLWITPSTTMFPRLPPRENMSYLPIICVSASKQIEEGVGRRTNGFSYVQGSGDDHELWGMGLTPTLFWEHNKELLEADRDDLPSVVESIVTASKCRQGGDTWKALPTPVEVVGGRVLIGAESDIPSTPPLTIPGVDKPVSYVIISSSVQDPQAGDTGAEGQVPPPGPAHILRLRMAEGKKDQLHFLQSVLPESMRYIRGRLAKGDAICVCCESGKDASVGVALAALQLFFDDQGALVVKEDGTTTPVNASKASIKTRLQWIISSRPQANPSRVTLRRVNEFLLSSPAFRRR
ncbi:initiator tRNA phosphoribosyl transferase [Trametes polyzona]|nr:initiator tRNA phosphoribosyl transferase [Trametes polyzona]